MEFKDLKIGDSVYILENTGTFRKITTYNVGQVINVSNPYDDNTMNNQYLSQMLKKKLVDLTISCDGIQKKLTVGADKSTITDNTIGLTVSSDKQSLIDQVTAQYKEYEDKIASIERYKEEANKCKSILEQLSDKPKEQIITEKKSEPLQTDLIRVS